MINCVFIALLRANIDTTIYKLVAELPINCNYFHILCGIAVEQHLSVAQLSLSELGVGSYFGELKLTQSLDCFLLWSCGGNYLGLLYVILGLPCLP